MRLFAATLTAETNTFAVVPTGRIDFEAQGLFCGDASTRAPEGSGVFHAALQRLAAVDGHEVVESLAATAAPAGPTARAVYEEFREIILRDLKAALSVDAVFLFLHGAMVADGYDDCEGDLIGHIRALVGPKVPIGVELDLHCHFTASMAAGADILISYKEYPHIDGLQRLEELYRLLTRQAAGEILPVTVVHDCRMVGLWHTTAEPMASFVRRMQEIEALPDVLSVSLGHGFPYGDVVENGARVWVTTDNRPALAQELARQLAAEFWMLRAQASQPPLPIATALDLAAAAPQGPVVLADVGDNAGGGAMGDSTFVLKALLARGLGNAALGCYWDPGAVMLCQSAGVGARLSLRIGGKCGPLSGDPIDLVVTVRAIAENVRQPALFLTVPLGTVVWVQADREIDLVLTTLRSQVFSPEVFTGLGIDLAAKHIVVVKSTQHFRVTFAPLAREILYLASPGATAQDFTAIPYTKRSLQYWPRVANPFAALSAETP